MYVEKNTRDCLLFLLFPRHGANWHCGTTRVASGFLKKHTKSQKKAKVWFCIFWSRSFPTWKTERYASSFLSSFRFPTFMAVTTHFFSAAVSRITCRVDRPTPRNTTQHTPSAPFEQKLVFPALTHDWDVGPRPSYLCRCRTSRQISPTCSTRPVTPGGP